MKTPESNKRDIKACIAAGIAGLCDPGDRVAAVVGTLRVDEIEARLLISRGRRLVRAATSQSTNLDDRASSVARQKGERV